MKILLSILGIAAVVFAYWYDGSSDNFSLFTIMCFILLIYLIYIIRKQDKKIDSLMSVIIPKKEETDDKKKE